MALTKKLITINQGEKMTTKTNYHVIVAITLIIEAIILLINKEFAITFFSIIGFLIIPPFIILMIRQDTD